MTLYRSAEYRRREAEGLNKRQLFRCALCKQIVPWSQGCADDMPEACDACWAYVHAKDTT